MSLFPAYSTDNTKKVVDATEQESSGTGEFTDAAKVKWQSNRSYKLPHDNNPDSSSASSSKSKSDSSSDSESESNPKSIKYEICSSSKRLLEFSSSVEYYVDKSSNKAHMEWQTLPHLSRPLYKIQLSRLTDPLHPWARANGVKRQRQRSSNVFKLPAADMQQSEAAKTTIMERIRELNVLIANEPQRLDKWLELHELLGQNVSKSNRLAVAEHQLHSLETALEHHPGNEQLLQQYVATTSATYPDSQVATKIEQLLRRSPYEYTLWTALIMSTQGTMARCNVPDVLQIYEQCMRRMHLGPKDQRQQTDQVMLKLYHNCVLFLRQSANLEKMFALLRLALELNFPRKSFSCFEAHAADEQPLVDYEELVLSSGMPMTEIWTRIERLRQAYQFLPCQRQLNLVRDDEDQEEIDPQRCVYSTDVCHYIYPLKEPKNTLHLLLLTVQLTKLPLARSSCLAERLSARISQIGDSDAIEMLLASLGERFSYILPMEKPSDVYWSAVMELCRELCVSPSFMPHTIGCDLYQQCLEHMLLQCSNAFDGQPADEPKRQIFLVLWFRFRRLCLRLLHLSGKPTDNFVASTRKAQRDLLMLTPNRDVTRFFTELAMFEYEAELDKKAAFNTLDRLVLRFSHKDADHLYVLVVYTEMLLGQQKGATAMQLLHFFLPNSRQLLCEALQTADSPTDAMPLEDYFLPDGLVLLVRLHCLHLYLHRQIANAKQLLVELLDEPLFALGESYHLSTYRREQLRELQLLMMQLAWKPPPSLTQVAGFLEQSLQEFPRNLVLLQRCSTLASLPWYKLRMRLMHTKAGIVTLLHLVIAARCRFQHQQQQHRSSQHVDEELQLSLQQSQTYLAQLLRNRLLNMFETLLPTNPHRSPLESEQYAILRRNSLYWRLYLRCLSTEETSFERSKSCLLMALDECPWDKAIYMDGVTHVPPELANLQDVMMEKQLRIYAIPEELNVLRESDSDQ